MRRSLASYPEKISCDGFKAGAVYGPRETDIFAYFKMVRQGIVFIPSIDQKVSFIHVTDLVEAILKAAHSPKSKSQVYFASDGQSYSWQELSASIGKALHKTYFTFKVPMVVVKIVAVLGKVSEKITGKSSMVNLDKIKEAYFPSWVCSNRKISSHLGFKPRFDIQKGVQDAVKFYHSAGWLKS